MPPRTSRISLRARLTDRYQFCDNCFIYPITPSTPMATNVDAFASRGLKNVFGQVG